VRDAACSGLGFLGVKLDRAANAAVAGDAELTAPEATVRVLVVEAREDIRIVRQVCTVLGNLATGGDQPSARS
jgi:acetate kinase